MSDPAVREKVADAVEEKYGVRNVLSRMDLRREWMLEKYGVEHPMYDPEISRKTWETKVALGQDKVFISKCESDFYEILLTRFPDAVHGIWCEKWPIDYYVPSLELYVQMDGIYWHGLDRPLRKIRMSAASGHINDRMIFHKLERDREQYELFRERGLKLFRISEDMFHLHRRLGTFSEVLDRMERLATDSRVEVRIHFYYEKEK
jgi:hypothetical protein